MGNKRTYQFNKSKLTIEFGDITTSEAQVIVSSDDYYLSMGGGVSASILGAGGNAIALDAAKKVPAELGEVVVTTAGRLPAQYIFHAVTIGSGDLSPENIIKQTTKGCMQLIDTLKLSSIAFPAIGAGVAGFSYEDVAAQMADVISDDLQKRKTAVQVTIYLFDRFAEKSEFDFVEFFEEFAARAPKLAGRAVTATPAKEKMDNSQFDSSSRFNSLPDDIPETDAEIKMRRLHNLRKLIGSLEDQRFELEARLIELIGGGEEREVKKIRRKLQENQELRLSYLNEIKALSEHGSETVIPSTPSDKRLLIFVSSTYKDLIAYRNSVKDQIMSRDMLFRGMEIFGADPNRKTPATLIVDEVRKCDVYLGIFGVRYGYIDEATGLSMTELEFNEAEASGKRMLLYVIRDDAQVKVSELESDPIGRDKLDKLKSRILKNHVVYGFNSVEDLAGQVYKDLGKL